MESSETEVAGRRSAGRTTRVLAVVLAVLCGLGAVGVVAVLVFLSSMLASF